MQRSHLSQQFLSSQNFHQLHFLWQQLQLSLQLLQRSQQGSIGHAGHGVATGQHGAATGQGHGNVFTQGQGDEHGQHAA